MRTLTPLLLLFVLPASAQDWSNWRGPRYDGSTTVVDLPHTFSKTENVRWVSELPGPGAGTPIVVGERIFLTAIAEEDLVALCLDRETGEELWGRAVGSGYRPGGDGTTTQISHRSNYASPSPACDGERVIFSFGNGDLVCLDLEGEELWRRNLQQDHGDYCFQWTYSSSPTLLDGRLHCQVLQRDQPVHERGKKGAESFLLAFDAKSGELLYRSVRPSKAIVESLESYATPIPFVNEQGSTELLIMGGDVITAHNPADGAELWRWGTWNEGHREQWWRVVPSPVLGGGVALACGPKGAPVCAVKLDGKGELAWKSPDRRSPLTTDVPTPLYYDGAFFVLSDLRSALSRVDPASGEIAWSVDLPRDVGLWRASPTGADGRVWVVSHGGEVMVFDAQSGELGHRVSMGEEDDDHIRSSVVAAHGAVFLRTNTSLFCIGESEKEE